MEGFLENSITCKASIGGGALLAWPRLWPVIQKYHFGSVDGVGLPNFNHFQFIKTHLP